jgi:hypothetical protein
MMEGDVERMNKASMRLYLQRRLHTIEDRIRVLSYAQASRSAQAQFAWNLDQLDADAWDDLLQLDYLETMREAVVEALAVL